MPLEPLEPIDGTAPMARGELQDRAVKGAMWTVAHTLIALPLAFLVNLVVANVLGSADFGRLAVLTLVMEIATGVVSLGLTPAVIQFGSKAHARGDREEVRRILRASQGFRLLVVAPLLTIVVLVAAQVSDTYLVLAVVFGVWVPAALAGAPICLGVENKTASGARIAMVINLVLQVAVVVTVINVRTPDSVWATRLIVGGALVVLALLPISRDYRRAVLRPTLPRRLPAGFWRFAIPAGIAGLLSTLVLSRTEVFFLGAFDTEAAAGVYALAFGVAGYVFAPAEALVGPLVPAVSGLRAIDRDHMLLAFERAVRGATTLVGLVVASALAPLVALVPLLYPKYPGAAPLVLALGISGAFTVSSGILTAFVMARYSAGQTLVGNLVSLTVNLGAAFTLIPAFGIWGAVWSNIAGALTRFLFLLTVERRALALPVGRMLAFWAPLAVAATACLAAWLAMSTLRLHPVLDAVLAVAVSMTVFVVGMRTTRAGLGADDIGAVTRVVPARLRPAAERLLHVALAARAGP